MQKAVVLTGPVNNQQKALLVLCTRITMATAAWRSMSKASVAAAKSHGSDHFEDLMYPVLSLISIGGEMVKMVQFAASDPLVLGVINVIDEPHRALLLEIATTNTTSASERGRQINGMKLIRDRMYAHYDERVVKPWIDKVMQSEAPSEVPFYIADPENEHNTQRFPWAWWSILNQIANTFNFSEISDVQRWQLDVHKLSALTCVACEALAASLLALLPIKWIDWKNPDTSPPRVVS